MILNQQLFDVKIINPNNGELILYLPPQQVNAIKMEKKTNGISNLVLTTRYTDTIWNAYLLDALVEVSTINYETMLLESEETFFMRKKDVYIEGDIQQIAFYCVGLLDLVKRRVIKPTPTDISSAGGYSTKAGDVSDVIEEFIDEQIINPSDITRTFPNLTFSKISGGNQVGVRTRFENLFDILDKIRINGRVSFRIRRVSDNDLVFEVGQLWTDRTYTTHYPSGDYLIFSPSLGNTSNPSFEVDNTDVVNFIYVLGEGEGSNQKLLEINGLGQTESAYNKIEGTIESRRGAGVLGSANQQALTIGLKQLHDKRVKKSFDFEMIENRLGFLYRVNWDVGDYVTFYWLGEIVDFEIKSTTFTVSGNQVTRTISLEPLED